MKRTRTKGHAVWKGRSKLSNGNKDTEKYTKTLRHAQVFHPLQVDGKSYTIPITSFERGGAHRTLCSVILLGLRQSHHLVRSSSMVDARCTFDIMRSQLLSLLTVQEVISLFRLCQKDIL